MSSAEIIIAALSMAFCWVVYINPFACKPFNCVKCMCGWFSVIIGCFAHGLPGLLYLPAGIFAGAVYEAVNMRFL